MCYAIPGKVTRINKKIISVDYFGEERKARNDFYRLKKGDYVYAQGGFIVSRISEKEAKATLDTWQELFFKLKERDLRFSEKSGNLRKAANRLRQKKSGNSCCVHGIIEFSNYCRNDCLYCGLRHSNCSLTRYRMKPREIVDLANFSIDKLKFKALVLQSGEDTWYTEEKLVRVVKGIFKRNPALLILSIGERNFKIYERLYRTGARAALLRFETSNEALYRKMRPGHSLKERLELIKKLRKLGYLIMTGFLIGLPGENNKDLLNDIKLAASLKTDMFSFGPFIPHPKTPLGNEPLPSLDKSLDTIARARLMNPEAKILVTTALEALDKDKGLKLGLLSGGNSLMVNVTPDKYKRFYDLYPDHSGVGLDLKKKIDRTLKLLYSLGRAPVDLGL